MAIQNEPTRIQIPFADSGTKNVIPDTNSTPSASQAASWTDGFPAQCSLPLSAGGIPPARADFNGILNAITQSERFTQEGGVWAWDATVDYAANRAVLGSDGKLYWSVAQSGPNVGEAQDPTADNGTYWQAMPTDDANIVHRTGNEFVGGSKFFTDQLYLDPLTSGRNLNIVILNRNYDNVSPSSGESSFSAFYFEDKNSVWTSRITSETSYTSGSNCSNRIRFGFRKPGVNSGTTGTINTGLMNGSIISIYPEGGDHRYVGMSDHKWETVYATTGTIQTSDERLKSFITAIPDDVLDAWGDLSFYQFKFNDAVAEKGDEDARFHNGLVAQRIDEAFKARGLDASRYGLFCWDSWDAQPEERDEDGAVVQEARPAGDGYSIRYEEALCMEAAYQRRRADRAESRLAALEERLAAIEAKLLNS